MKITRDGGKKTFPDKLSEGCSHRTSINRDLLPEQLIKRGRKRGAKCRDNRAGSRGCSTHAPAGMHMHALSTHMHLAHACTEHTGCSTHSLSMAMVPAGTLPGHCCGHGTSVWMLMLPGVCLVIQIMLLDKTTQIIITG